MLPFKSEQVFKFNIILKKIPNKYKIYKKTMKMKAKPSKVYSYMYICAYIYLNQAEKTIFDVFL